MLGKLLRYDLRSMWKQFSILWPALLVVALMTRMLGWALSRLDFGVLSSGWLEGSAAFFLQVMPIMVYFALIVALMVITLIYVVQRFYSGLTGAEGYLMHMLPVRTWQLIASKLIVATVVVVISGAAGLLSIGILAGGMDFLWDFLDIFPRMDLSGALVLVHLGLMAVLSLWSWVTQVYAACAFGQLSNKNRALLSVVAYVVINIIQSTLLFCLFLGLGVLETNTGFLSSWAAGMVRVLQLETISAEGAFHLLLGIADLFFLAKDAVFFLITEYLLRRKLNLQ